jgi:hypothetical protein
MTHRTRLRADFMGIWDGGRLICLSHSDSAIDESGFKVPLDEGMEVTAFDEDLDDAGNRDCLVATGIVAQPPEWLKHKGSRWVLIVNEHGIKHESEM